VKELSSSATKLRFEPAATVAQRISDLSVSEGPNEDDSGIGSHAKTNSTQELMMDDSFVMPTEALSLKDKYERKLTTMRNEN
jgi:hypothetical protein